MWNDLSVPFDRVTFRDGQLLTARDLGDAASRQSRLLALHTRYMHGTWGIAVGFEIALAPGNAAVDVGPGYAIDETGSSLLLAEGIRVPVPASSAPTPFVLVAAYQEDAAYRSRPGAPDLCNGGAGISPGHERPVISWRTPDDIRFGPEVPIVQVVASGGVVQGSLDRRVRRYARRLIRPYLATGHTEPGQTGWTTWQAPGDPEFARQLGVEVVVDTSEAGFTRIPTYFATIQGDFNGLPSDLTNFFASGQNPPVPDPAFYLSSFGFVTNAQPDRFTYRVVLGRKFPMAVALGADQLKTRRWAIAWLGVESRGGCAPTLRGSRLLSLLGTLIRLKVASPA